MKDRDFPDKKRHTIEFDRATQYLQEGRRIGQEFEIGQKEATWRPKTQFDNLPVALILMSDMHYGSTRVNYDLLLKHLNIVNNTPNFYMATNGDHIDNFNPVVHPSGMMENPLPPQMQARAFMNELLQMDRRGKIACMAHGNHDDFMNVSGMDFYESFLSRFRTPIFTQGGILNIDLKNTKYRMALNHTYWGRSKLNITNAAKRLMEYEGNGSVDIGWLGHTHQSSFEHFTKGKDELIAVVSGTYKEDDSWAAKRGIGGRAGTPGITLMLWQDTKHMEVFKSPDKAKEYMDALVKVKTRARVGRESGKLWKIGGK